MRKWRFPDVTLGAGETLIVFASGFDRSEGTLHTSFRLSSEGETVILADKNGRVMDRMSYDLCQKNQSFTRGSDGNWLSDQTPTPGTR